MLKVPCHKRKRALQSSYHTIKISIILQKVCLKIIWSVLKSVLTLAIYIKCGNNREN